MNCGERIYWVKMGHALDVGILFCYICFRMDTFAQLQPFCGANGYHKLPVMQSLDGFFLSNQQIVEQARHRSFETP